MRAFFQKRWFLCFLLVFIVGGMTAGWWVSAEAFERTLSRLGPWAGTVLNDAPRLATAFVLFLMSFTLHSGHLRASLRSPGPVLWATVVNFAGIPLLAWMLMPLQRTPDFSVGLMIAGSVPCTMAAASVWARKAGGNDAVSLMVTLLTNGVCFAVTPFWLVLTTGAHVELDATAMMLRLVTAVLVPAAIGQGLRQFARPAAFAVRYKTPLGVVAQASILIIVLIAACKAGHQLRGDGPRPAFDAVLIVWLSVMAVHLIALAGGIWGARAFGFAEVDCRAVAFAASQKTLPIGVLLATDPGMFGSPDALGAGVGVPFAVFPMLMYHASQLFIDTAIADRMAARDQLAMPADEVSV